MGKININGRMVEEQEYSDYLDVFLFHTQVIDHFKMNGKDRPSKSKIIMDSFLIFNKKYKITKR